MNQQAIWKRCLAIFDNNNVIGVHLIMGALRPHDYFVILKPQGLSFQPLFLLFSLILNLVERMASWVIAMMVCTCLSVFPMAYRVLYAVAADRQVTRITSDDFVRRHHLKNEEKKQNGSPAGELF